MKIQARLPALHQGIPFPKTQSNHMTRVLGFPVSHEGLTKMYEGCLDGSHCYITDVNDTHNGFEYAVSWRDHDGEELARAISHLARHEDGSLELHRSDVYVAHHCRGQAVNIKILEKEIAMVRKGSDHPESRVTLEAGGMPVNGVRERLGTYTWARYGFDFADNYKHGVSDLVDYGSHSPGRSSMRRQFKAWIQNHADGPLSQELNKLADSFKHPWEIASLKIDGHKFPVTVGDEVSQCDVGKAFMLSEFCENYGAAYRVNDPQFAGKPVAEKAFASQLKTAQDKLTQERAGLEKDLQNAPEKALEQLRHRGGSEWIPRLEALCEKRRDLKEKIEETIDAIRGGLLLRGLKHQLRNCWTESTRSVLDEQKERLETGWTGTVCHIGDRPVYYKWKAKFKKWASNWFHTQK
ncbi:MAG: hypothetical protein J0I12_31585 [Candidatus Eremiobacteraeota bacterium]|nr:hypothetical protein [Candidatus Eremiobacteraeota bacterium]